MRILHGRKHCDHESEAGLIVGSQRNLTCSLFGKGVRQVGKHPLTH